MLTRRTLMIAMAAAPLRADSADQVREVLASFASALSDSNDSLALDAFDKSMPEYERLRANIAAMVNEAAIENSIDVLENDGDDQKRTMLVDWVLRIEQRTGATAAVRRQQKVTVKFEKRGRKWKIVGLDPVSFFDMPRF